MSKLPAAYRWLLEEPGPRILVEYLKIYGTTETSDAREILRWAKVIGLDRVYKSVRTAWCGLGMGYVAGQAGYDPAPRGNALWAANWALWGDPSPGGVAMLGDVLVFRRKGGNHVGIYVGEDQTHYHVLGANQENAVNIRRKPKKDCWAVRRCRWRIAEPSNVRRVFLSSAGAPVSKSEA